MSFEPKFEPGRALLIHGPTGIVADAYFIEERGGICAVRRYSELVLIAPCGDALAYIEAALASARAELAGYTAVEGPVQVVKPPGIRELRAGRWGRLYRGTQLAVAYDLDKGALIRPGYENLIRRI